MKKLQASITFQFTEQNINVWTLQNAQHVETNKSTKGFCRINLYKIFRSIETSDARKLFASEVSLV